MDDEKVKYKILLFNVKNGENFHLWDFRLNTALRGKELISSIKGQNIDFKVNRKDLSTIAPALGGNLLRAIHDRQFAKIYGKGCRNDTKENSHQQVDFIK